MGLLSYGFFQLAAQPGVEVGRHGGGVADGGDTADDLSGVAAYEVGIGAGERAGADPLRGRGVVDPVGAGRQDQDGATVVVEDQTVGDRCDLAAECFGGQGGGADRGGGAKDGDGMRRGPRAESGSGSGPGTG